MILIWLIYQDIQNTFQNYAWNVWRDVLKSGLFLPPHLPGGWRPLPACSWPTEQLFVKDQKKKCRQNVKLHNNAYNMPQHATTTWIESVMATSKHSKASRKHQESQQIASRWCRMEFSTMAMRATCHLEKSAGNESEKKSTSVEILRSRHEGMRR